MALKKLYKGAVVDTEIDDEDDNTQEGFESPNFSTDDVFTLPAGYVDSQGVVHTDFTLREMTGRDEEAISKSDVKNNPSKGITALIRRCVTRIGSYEQKKMSPDKWAAIFDNLLVGDADYIIMQIKKISYGDEIKVSHVCPECSAKLETAFSVDELEVVPFKGLRDIPFVLPRGYTDRKGVVHTKGYMRMPTNKDREVLTPLSRTNIAKATTTMLTRTCRFESGMYVTDDIMSDLLVKDREYLANLIEEHSSATYSAV